MFKKLKLRRKFLNQDISTRMRSMHIYYHTGPDTYQSRDLSDDISVITVLGCAISNIFWVTQDRDQVRL